MTQMMKFDTHVCMVSEQIDPNLLPILNKDTRPKKVVLLVSKPMEKIADRLNEAIEKYVKVSRYPIDDPFDINSIEETLFEVAEKENLTEVGEDGSSEGCVFNITGGTKLMSTACYLFCSQMDIPFFYLNHQDNDVQLINPKIHMKDGEHIKHFKLNFQFNEGMFNSYAIAHGYRLVENHDDFVADDTFVQKFFDEVKKTSFRNAVAQLNALASQAKSSQLEVQLLPHRSPEFECLLDVLVEANWVKVKDHNQKLVFKDEKTRDFLNGKWFEYYLQQQLKTHILKGNRIFRSLEIQTGKYKNEFDLMFFHEGKSFVIEAKTALINDDNSKQDIIHKLSQVSHNFGGHNARAALISYQPITDKSVRQRAEDAGISTIHGDQVVGSSLISMLRKWIQ